MLGLFAVLAGIAEILNLTLWQYGELSMFYLSPYLANTPAGVSHDCAKLGNSGRQRLLFSAMATRRPCSYTACGVPSGENTESDERVTFEFWSKTRYNKRGEDNEFSRRMLCAWYKVNHRESPFRQTRDPYAIWVSEIMAQQTRIDSMLPYYQRWMERWPTVQALAEAPIEEVLAHLAGTRLL